MENYHDFFNTEKELEEALSRPTPEVVQMMKTLRGDIIFLGVAGKMGVSMANMAKRACEQAGVNKKIIGVARFSNPQAREYLQENGIDTIKGDLVDLDFIRFLPSVENVVYMAGMKFGTNGNEPFTWAMNSFLPGLVAEKYKQSRIVALSTGCVYPFVNVRNGGSLETDPADPVGEYAQSCLGRERLFEYGSKKYGTPVVLIRLFYAVEMRYGVLVDIANKVYNEEPIDVTMGYVNVIWQGDANALILQSLALCKSPAEILNITGPETIYIREVAAQFAKLMNKNIHISGMEADTALLGNAGKSFEMLGRPKIPLEQVIKWTADWIMRGKKQLGKLTHYEVRSGKY